MTLCAQVCLCLCVSHTLASLECYRWFCYLGILGPTCSPAPLLGTLIISWALHVHHLRAAPPSGQASQSFSLAFCFCSTSVAFDLSLLLLQLCGFGKEWQNLPPPDSISTHLFPPPNSARVNTIQLGGVLWPPIAKLTSF